MKFAKEIPLGNELTVRFYHHIHRYFGDYHRIKVEIVCEVPVREEYFSSTADFTEALASLGESATFRRKVEMMGIPTNEVEQTIENVIMNFSNHSLSYLSSHSFPRKLLLAELAGARRGERRVYKDG